MTKDELYLLSSKQQKHKFKTHFISSVTNSTSRLSGYGAGLLRQPTAPGFKREPVSLVPM